MTETLEQPPDTCCALCGDTVDVRLKSTMWPGETEYSNRWLCARAMACQSRASRSPRQRANHNPKGREALT